MTIRVSDAFKAAPGLSPVRRQKVIDYLTIPKDDDCPLTTGAALFIWVAQLLNRRSGLDLDAQDLILTTFKKTVVDYGNLLAEGTKSKKSKHIPVAMLHLVDERYVCLSGSDLILDLREGATVAGMPNMGLETVGWSLPILFSLRLGKVPGTEASKLE